MLPPGARQNRYWWSLPGLTAIAGVEALVPSWAQCSVAVRSCGAPQRPVYTASKMCPRASSQATYSWPAPFIVALGAVADSPPRLTGPCQWPAYQASWISPVASPQKTSWLPRAGLTATAGVDVVVPARPQP